MERRDPFRDLHDRLNNLFEEFTDQRHPTRARLPIDMRETEDELIIQADLPGVEKDNINLTIRNNTLHIQADDTTELHEEGKDYIRQERRAKRYGRRVSLPVPVDPETADATYDDGVLTVEVKKQAGGRTDIDIQ